MLSVNFPRLQNLHRRIDETLRDNKKTVLFLFKKKKELVGHLFEEELVEAKRKATPLDLSYTAAKH